MFAIDGVKETESTGEWTTFSGADLCIASSSSMAYQKKMARLYRPHRKAVDRGSMNPEVARDVMCQAMAGVLLTDWKNVTSGGKELKFSEENAFIALTSNEDLRDFVTEFAGDIANFRNEAVEATVKA